MAKFFNIFVFLIVFGSLWIAIIGAKEFNNASSTTAAKIKKIIKPSSSGASKSKNTGATKALVRVGQGSDVDDDDDDINNLNAAPPPGPNNNNKPSGEQAMTLLAGYPVTGHRSAHAIGRQTLIELLDSSIFRHPNMDDRPIRVMITLIPLKIQDLNEKMEILETTVRLQLAWEDRRLAWDPRLFSNISEVIVGASTIWAPDIAILNSVSDVYDVIRDMRFEVKIENTGRLWWHPTGIIKTYCKLYLRYFPFDRQTCWIIFESPTLDLRFMNLTLRSNIAVDTRMYLPGETWQLLNWGGRSAVSQVGRQTFFSRVEFYLHVERAVIYHVLNVILPAVFLSCVQIMFFLVPVTHPQRVGSSTTTLLSVVVFQTVAIAHLPNTSTDVPLLTIYIFFVVIVSAISVSTSIVVAKLAVYAEKKVPMPKWLQKIPHPKIFLRPFRKCCTQPDITISQNDIINIISEGNQQSQPIAGFIYLEPNNNNSNNEPNIARRPSCQHCLNKTSSNASSLLQHPTLVTAASIRSTVIEDEIVTTCHPTASRSASNQSHRTHPPLTSLVDQHFQYYLQGRINNNRCGHHGGCDIILTPPFKNAGETTSTECESNWPPLFKDWNDVSIYFDTFLMVIAASIAMVSPVILFVIVPYMAEDFDPTNVKLGQGL